MKNRSSPILASAITGLSLLALAACQNPIQSVDPVGTDSRTVISATTRIEAESFTQASGVITEACSEGGQNVGAIDAGDWMIYPITINAAGSYTIQYRVASIYSGKSLSSDLSAGAVQLGSVAIPYTGGWQTWTTVSQTVNLAAGTYNFGINAGTGGFNINWFSITAPNTSPGWNLVWSDEFSGSGQPNAANWNYEVGNGYNPGLPGFQGWGNGEWEWYRPENSYQQSGNLVIKANYSTTPLYNVGGRNWYQTSGRLTTHGKQSWQYGRIEARMQLPTASGNWSAFWMMGTSISGATNTASYNPAPGYYDTMATNWASCGEIDIMEHVNGGNIGINNCFWDTRVGLYPWTSGMVANYGNTNVNYGNVAQFHVYAIEWDAASIKWFCDGVQTHAIDITPAALEEFRKPFYIILNLAIGGSITGTPNAADFPLYMYVDYVRVYKKS